MRKLTSFIAPMLSPVIVEMRFISQSLRDLSASLRIMHANARCALLRLRDSISHDIQ